ncbi:hypothetical protein LBMAG53_00740 [Planctomycetota bacterium]|nr:hypothetical protein LBMAG53_00740 [Planctomycetota bacterium]
MTAASLPELLTALAARTPTPGGGAAAAWAAALGCAAGAMAARYTSGAKYAAVAETAANLATELDRSAAAALELAERDAAAYSAVTTARKNGGDMALAEAAAAQIPADLLALCALQAGALAAFLPTCNPNLASDVRVGVHLLAGAGRAAWATLLVNRPGAELLAVAESHRAALDAAELGLR